MALKTERSGGIQKLLENTTNNLFGGGFAWGIKGMENTRKTGHAVIRFISVAHSSHIITKHMEKSYSLMVQIGRVFSIRDAPATFGNC